MRDDQYKRMLDEFEHTRFTVRRRTVPWFVYYLIVVCVLAIFGRACAG